MMCSESCVYFINVSREAIPLVDPKTIKKIDNLSIILTHLGSLLVKAARKMLIKLSPEKITKKMLGKCNKNNENFDLNLFFYTEELSIHLSSILYLFIQFCRCCSK